MNELYLVGAVDTDWADGHFVKFDQNASPTHTLTMLHKARLFYSFEGAEECRTKAQLQYPNYNFQVYKYALVGGYKPSKHTNERRLDTDL
jgi:hypothetical protein